MAKSKSTIKRAEQALRKRRVNRSYKTRMKKAIKKVILAAKSGESDEELSEMVREAQALIDKAASKGVIHKNQAARRKSRLVKAVKVINSKAQETRVSCCDKIILWCLKGEGMLYENVLGEVLCISRSSVFWIRCCLF